MTKTHPSALSGTGVYCKWCAEQYKKPTVEERYGNPRTGCVLWPMMEIKDEAGNPTRKGYNDWVFERFVQRKDSSHKQYHASLRDLSMKMGRRYANEIVEGCFGAYMVDEESSPFYIVQWSGQPWRAEKDSEECVDGHVYTWNKGDYL